MPNPPNPLHEALSRHFTVNSIDFKANDSLAHLLDERHVAELRKGVEAAAQQLLRSLVIDVDNDHNTEGTAKRIAKMFVDEVFAGRYHERPAITKFPNAKKLDELYCTGPITVRSTCSHHFQPIHGKCWVGIIPGDYVMGLSKFNRLVDWVCARPQIQEEMVVQIADEIEKEIQPKGLAVIVKATHFCMVHRGVCESHDAAMTTSVMRGTLMEDTAARAEFLRLIGL